MSFTQIFEQVSLKKDGLRQKIFVKLVLKLYNTNFIFRIETLLELQLYIFDYYNCKIQHLIFEF